MNGIYTGMLGMEYCHIHEEVGEGIARCQGGMAHEI